ncbi:hypothetical protein VP01_3604g1 [Puccinia sorghi]|uniref:Retrovirus-related Pol polyprotein from transposon TNT 1-94-like beta-barrel domain-containing protein n=1 Tax=Puccinia sorghi TaxID=27349 RepID=A0A0L6UV17_9BASI|nr:hypothetical protein VP01_3604g1 [Puccinia sorghi]
MISSCPVIPNRWRPELLKRTGFLTEENYSIWKDKMEALSERRGLLTTLNSPTRALFTDDNAELKLLLISKMDSVTHSNVVTAENRDSAKALWNSIKEQFASSQSSNQARVFNNFLYQVFREENIKQFVTKTKVAIKKLVDEGIDLPQDVLAYLILFKFLATLHSLKQQVMHSEKDLTVHFVCNHLTQYNKEAKAETKEDSVTTDAALYSNKDKRKKKSKPGKSKTLARCTHNYHNPKQDENHKASSCWHLHPDKAPDWWKKEQAKWKASKSESNYFMSLLTLWVEKGDNKLRIILDSGALAHIFNDEQFFSQITKGDFEVIKTGKENATLPIKGKGSVRLKWGNSAIQLEDCLYVPDIVINLVSAGTLDRKGCQIHLESGNFYVKKNGTLALKGKVTGNLFTVENPTNIGQTNKRVNYSPNGDLMKEIHESYGHASIQLLGHVLPSHISNQEKLNFQCKSRMMSKITKKPFKLTSQKVKKPWERIHLDLIGPIKPQSLGQHKYILSVTDKTTGYLAGLPLVHKSNTTDVLIRLLENENRRIGYFSSQIGSDGGGQFIGTRAERENWKIVESMQATFKSSNLKKNLWHYVVKLCSIQGCKLPDNYLKPLGNSVVFLRNLQKKGEKFSEKGSKGRLIGYNPAFRSYKIISSDGSVINPQQHLILKNHSPWRTITINQPKRGTIKLHGLRLGIKRGTTQAIQNLTLKLIKATSANH